MENLNNEKKNESLELAFESLESCNGYVDHIIGRIQKCVGHFNGNQAQEANEELVQVIELMDLYIQLMSKVYKIIRRHDKDQILKDESLQKLEIHLLSVVRALLQAKEKNDLIMLCDLLEYELIDNLTQWKIKVIPELKKLKNI